MTVVEGEARIFDYDLGHAIGGQCVHKIRARVRAIQSSLKHMGPDPWYNIEAYKKLGHQDKLTQVFLLNHEQAKAVAADMDPLGHTDVHYRVDLLFYHVANGRFAELVSTQPGLGIALASDARAKRQAIVPQAHRDLPRRPKPAALPALPADPYALLAIRDAIAAAVDKTAIREAIQSSLEPVISEMRDKVAEASRLSTALNARVEIAAAPDAPPAAAGVAALVGPTTVEAVPARPTTVQRLTSLIRKVGGKAFQGTPRTGP